MRSTFLALICLCLATLAAPRAATAAGCGPGVKIVYIWSSGYIPDKQYICAGQQVALVNNSGTYVSFKYRDAYNREIAISNLRPGSYIWVDAATTIYAGSTYGRYGHPITDGQVLWGMAPDSY